MQQVANNSSYYTTLCFNGEMARADRVAAAFLVMAAGYVSMVSSCLVTPAVVDGESAAVVGDDDGDAMLFPFDLVSKIRTDRSSIAGASTDFGRIVEAVPAGVFHPDSAADIAALLRFSLRQPTPFTVAPRGQGHSCRGQALAPAGIVVDMRSLGRRGGHVRRINVSSTVDGGGGGGGLYADVGGEQLWIDVLHASLRHGLAPLVWTDYLRLTVGGTLSNAGIGGQAFRHGPQISNVDELDVVTGTGDMITCSPAQNSDLFFATLGGLGQFGVITRARIRLEQAPRRVKWARLAYSDVRSFTRDQELLISKRADWAGFDYVEGQVQLNRTLNDGRRSSSSSFFSASELSRLAALAMDTGSVAIYYIEAAMYYDDRSAAADVEEKLAAVLAELRFVPGMAFVRDVPYVRFLDRVGREERKLRSAGAWDVPHPWLNLFVPRSRIVEFDAGVVGGILGAVAEPAAGLILMYPMRRDAWDARATAVTPDREDVFYAVGLLRSAGDLERLERENEAVLAFCDGAGIGCVQYLPRHGSPEGWRRHFGEARWLRIADLKAKYDPRSILSPGQRIFPAAAAAVAAS